MNISSLQPQSMTSHHLHANSESRIKTSNSQWWNQYQFAIYAFWFATIIVHVYPEKFLYWTIASTLHVCIYENNTTAQLCSLVKTKCNSFPLKILTLPSYGIIISPPKSSGTILTLWSGSYSWNIFFLVNQLQRCEISHD